MARDMNIGKNASRYLTTPSGSAIACIIRKLVSVQAQLSTFYPKIKKLHGFHTFVPGLMPRVHKSNDK